MLAWWAAPRVIPGLGLSVRPAVDRAGPWTVQQFSDLEVPFEVFNRTWYSVTLVGVDLPCGVRSCSLFRDGRNPVSTPALIPPGSRLTGNVRIESSGRTGSVLVPVQFRFLVGGFVIYERLQIPITVYAALSVNPWRINFDFRVGNKDVQRSRIVIEARSEDLLPLSVVAKPRFLAVEAFQRPPAGAATHSELRRAVVVVRCVRPGPTWEGAVSGCVVLRFKHPHLRSLRIPVVCFVPRARVEYRPHVLWIAPHEVGQAVTRRVWFRVRRGVRIRLLQLPRWAKVRLRQVTSDEVVATVSLRYPGSGPRSSKLTFVAQDDGQETLLEVPIRPVADTSTDAN